MFLKPLFLFIEIVLVDLIAHKIKPGIVGGNSGRAAAQMRVKDFKTGFCVVFENPLIQGNRFLRGVDSWIVLCPLRLRSSNIRSNALMYMPLYFGQRANSFSRFFPAIGQPTHPTRQNPSLYKGLSGTLASCRKPHTSLSVQSMIGLTTLLAFRRQFSKSIRRSSLSLLRIILCVFSDAIFSYMPRLAFREADSSHLTPVEMKRPAPPLFF